jgi:hypothetical protein
MDHIAFALRAEHEGTVQQGDEQVPKFGGGVLFVGDGDFHLRDELDAGDSVITVPITDDALISILDALPVFKRVPAPANPKKVVSPYDRRSIEALRFDAELRGLRQAGSLSKARLVRALQAHDEAQQVSLAAAQQVADQAPDIDPDEEPEGADTGNKDTTRKEA